MKNLTLLLFLSIPILSFGQLSEATLLGNWYDENITPAFFDNPYHDVWGCVVNEIEYGIITSTDGFHFFDMSTQPLSGEPVAFAPATVQGSQISHRDIKTYQNYLYAVADEGPSGLQVFDLSDLPNSVELVYESNEFISTTHNIFIDEANARLYALGGVGFNVKILSLENPEAPTLLASYPNGNYNISYVHDAYVRDNIAYLNNGNSGLVVTDFTDPANPVTLGTLTQYPHQGYNHSGWLTDDGQYYIMCDETHGTDIKVVDVSNLADMEVVATLNAGSTTNQIVHNVYIQGDVLYASYYYDGLQVFDISNPELPYRISYYDTYDEPNTNYFAGAWGMFVLPSGMPLISDMQTGFYFFEPIDVPLNTFIIPSSSMYEICEGNDFSFTITLGDEFETTGVDLSTGNVPTGSTVTFSPNPAQPGAAVEVTISGAEPGFYDLEIFATDNTNSGETSVAIEAIDMETANLINPSDEASNIGASIFFLWAGGANSDVRNIEISTSETNFDDNVFFTDETTLSSYSYSTAGLEEGTTYYWRVTADYGCGATYSQIYSFTTAGTVGINETILGNTFSLTPNPANDFVVLRFENPLEKDLDVELRAVSGQMIQSIQMQSQSNLLEFPVDDLANGLYVLRLISGNQTLSKKVMVQH